MDVKTVASVQIMQIAKLRLIGTLPITQNIETVAHSTPVVEYSAIVEIMCASEVRAQNLIDTAIMYPTIYTPVANRSMLFLDHDSWCIEFDDPRKTRRG